MPKIRVHQVAKDLGMSSKEFITRAQELGYENIQSHANTLEPSEAADLRSKIGQGRSSNKKRPTVLRRRAVRNSQEDGIQVVLTRVSEGEEKVIERKSIDLQTSTGNAEETSATVETVVNEPAQQATHAPEVVAEVPSAPSVEEPQSPAPVVQATTEVQDNADAAPADTPAREEAAVVEEVSVAETTPVDTSSTDAAPAEPETVASAPAVTETAEPTPAAPVEETTSVEAPAPTPTEKVDVAETATPTKTAETPDKTEEPPVKEATAEVSATTPEPAKDSTAPAVEAPTAETPKSAPTQAAREEQQKEPSSAPEASLQNQKVENTTPAKKNKAGFQTAKVIRMVSHFTPQAHSSGGRNQGGGRPGGPGGRPQGGRPGGPGGRPQGGRPSGGGRPNDNFSFQPPPDMGNPNKTDRGGRRSDRGKQQRYGAAGAGGAGRPGNRRRYGQDMDNYGGRRRNRKKDRRNKGAKSAVPSTKPMSEKKKNIKVDEAISVSELAHRMSLKAAELIRYFLGKGVMATMNQALSIEEATEVANHFGYEVEDVTFEEESILLTEQEDISEEELELRPPVVTVMGHVDHGKTSLLDAIRETREASREAGGITQHIGASMVELEGKGKLVLLDTPGHEAFTAMRARGAQATDIVILVVAADDSVMPQTIEAINHSKAAGVEIIVAINKIDKAGADPQKVRYELMQHELIPEELGGQTMMVDVSAHTKEGIDDLLETVLLQSEVLELKADPNRRAQGAVIESRIEKGRGPVTTMLVQNGTLHVGDAVVAGQHYGRVRAMFDHTNQPLEEAGPSIPVRVLGLSGLPEPGEQLNVVADERAAKQVADHRKEQIQKKEQVSTRANLSNIWAQQDKKKELNLIIKTDVQGSLEALKESLLKIKHEEIEVVVRHAAVGGITENDINLALATDAIILGFQVRADNNAQRLAESEGIEIRIYRVIYEVIEEVRQAMEQQLAPTIQEKPMGQVEIRKVFNIPKIGKIGGCYVLDGKVSRNALMRLFRNNIQIYEGKVASLRRFERDAKEVAAGYECGIQIEGYQDIQEGDIIEAYELEEIATKLN